MRKFNRKYNELRKITVEPHYNKYSEGSCLISFGETKVICTASIEKSVPKWLRNSGSGWITAEYSMIPRSTHQRMNRETKVGKQSGRSMEIQRLIGRSLRSVVDLALIPEMQIIIDCDVIQADGGTRTASITGAYIALSIAVKGLVKKKEVKKNPIKDIISAVSCGIFQDQCLLDLDYNEDSEALVDANFVLAKKLGIIEIQASGEQKPFSKDQFERMYDLAILGTTKLYTIQNDIINE